nr:MAG TPA: hypothetical protein [Caudoviricetes sp.]
MGVRNELSTGFSTNQTTGSHWFPEPVVTGSPTTPPPYRGWVREPLPPEPLTGSQKQAATRKPLPNPATSPPPRSVV